MKEKIIELLENENFLERLDEEISTHLQISTSQEVKELLKELNELEEQCIIMKDDDNKYYLSSHFNCYIGNLSLNKKGYGFVTIEGMEQDVFVSVDNLKGSIDGDTVFIQIFQAPYESKKEAKVLKLVKRNKTRIVGLLKKGKRDCYVESTILGLDKEVFIDKAHLHGAVVGHMVVVEIKAFKSNVKGTVIEVLGHKSDPGIDILAILK